MPALSVDEDGGEESARDLGAVKGGGREDVELVLHGLRQQVKCGEVEPVLQQHYHLLIVLSLQCIVLGVHDHGAKETLGVLHITVAVVPVGACEVGGEVVGEGGAREDGTLGNSGSSIHVRGTSLVLSVPVDGDSCNKIN